MLPLVERLKAKTGPSSPHPANTFDHVVLILIYFFGRGKPIFYRKP